MLSRSLNPCVDFRWLAFIVFTSVWWSTAAWPDDVLMMMAVFPVTLQWQTIISASHLLQLVCLFVCLSPTLSLSMSLSHVCVMCIDLYLDLCQHIDLVLHYSGQLGPQHANRRNATVLCLLSALVKLGRQMFKYPPPTSSPRQSDKLPL